MSTGNSHHRSGESQRLPSHSGSSSRTDLPSCSKTIYQSRRHHIPHDLTLQQQRSDKLISREVQTQLRVSRLTFGVWGRDGQQQTGVSEVITRLRIKRILQYEKYIRFLSYLTWRPAGNSTFQLATQNERNRLIFIITIPPPQRGLYFTAL